MTALRNALLAVLAWTCALTPGAHAQESEGYIIGGQDTLRIEVFNQPDLSGEYTVGSDGALSLPLIGRTSAAGLTVTAFEELLVARLAEGFLRNPRVTVAVEGYNSQQVFIVGEVRQPGAYAVIGDMRLIELLARAGSVTPAAAGFAVIVASDGAEPNAVPAGGDVEGTTRVDLDALQGGDLSQNVRLRHGDTVFIPEADVVYVVGEVRSPGQYAIRDDTIVLQVLALAGGGTEFAALNRIRISRLVDGEQVEIPAGLNDRVQPDDVVRVPERLF